MDVIKLVPQANAADKPPAADRCATAIALEQHRFRKYVDQAQDILWGYAHGDGSVRDTLRRMAKLRKLAEAIDRSDAREYRARQRLWARAEDEIETEI